jgi:hypothetical protein
VSGIRRPARSREGALRGALAASGAGLAQPVPPSRSRPAGGAGPSLRADERYRESMVTKRSVSLPDAVAAAVEVAATEDGVSFSAWLAQAADRQLRIREGLRGVEAWEAEAGSLTAEELAEGEALLARLLAGFGARVRPGVAAMVRPAVASASKVRRR